MVEKVIIAIMIFPLLLTSCSRGKTKNNNANNGISGTVYIVPKEAKADNDLGIIINLNLSKEKKINKSYKWYKNGQLISVNPILKRGNFKKGDTINAVVLINDRELKTKNVVIRNSSPEIYSAQIVKDSVFLKIIGNANDADNDSIILFIKWFNGSNLIGETTLLPLTKAGTTDSLYAIITPFDGTDSGTTYRTSIYKVKNTAPVITSSPQTHLSGDKFIYQVTAVDPEGDPIIFSLVDPPRGTKINAKTGLLTYTVSPEFLGDAKFIIKVSDNHGNYSLQKFSYNIK